MDDKIVPFARDQVVATFPGNGCKLLTVAGPQIYHRNPVIGFVVTKDKKTYPVTWTNAANRSDHIESVHSRGASERLDYEHALLHPSGEVEDSEGFIYPSVEAYVGCLKSRRETKESNARREKRRAAYQKAKARRKTKRHLKLLTDPS